jgi:CRP-like cAMP-binding protein
VGHSSTQVLVEVLKASGRIVELCVGFRAATVRGSPHPLSREQAALGSFFVEAAYQAGLQQPAPGGATARGRGPEPAGHGWPLNDAVDDAILLDPAALAHIAPRLADWSHSGRGDPGAILLDPAAVAAVAPRVASAFVKRAEQTHRCSVTGSVTVLFQMTSSKWSRACTPGLAFGCESFVTARAQEALSGMVAQAAQPLHVQSSPMQTRPARGAPFEFAPNVTQLRLTVSPSSAAQTRPSHRAPVATISAATAPPASAPPLSPVISPARARLVSRQMKGGELDPKIQHLRVRLRSMSYGSGKYSGQDPGSLFRQFDKDSSGELDQEEFFTAVRKGGGLTKRDVSDAELRKLFRAVDEDGDGSINIDEFTVFVWGGSRKTNSGEEVSGPIKTTSVAHIASIVAWGQQNEERRSTKRREEEEARAKAEDAEIAKKALHKRPISTDQAESLVKRLYGEELNRSTGQSPDTVKPTPSSANALDVAGSAVRWPECAIEGLAPPEPPPKRSVSTPQQLAVTTDRLYVPAGQERKKLIDQHLMAEEKERDQYRTWLPSDQVDQWPLRLGKWGPHKLEAIKKERRMKAAAERNDLLSRRALSDRETARLNQLSKATAHKKSQKTAKDPEADAAEVRHRKEARKRAAEKQKQDAAMRVQAAEQRAAGQAKKRQAEEEAMAQQTAAAEKRRLVAAWSGKLALILDDSNHDCAGKIGRVTKVNTRSMTSEVRLEGRSGKTVKVLLDMLASETSPEFRKKRDSQAAERAAAAQIADQGLLQEKIQESQRIKAEQVAKDREEELQRELSMKEAARILQQELTRRQVWLGEVPMFQGLATDGAFISELAKKLEVRTAGRGTTVIEKGADGHEMYFLVRGEAQVLAALDEPAFVVLKAGSFFGEGALLEGGLRNAYVCAGTSMKLYVLSKENLDVVLKEYPDVRKIIMQPLDERRKKRIDAENPLTLVRRKWLGDVPLFEGLATDGAFITELAMKLTVQTKEAGEIVIEKGSVGVEMYFIVQGEAEVLTSLDEPAFVLLQAGTFFGEGALLEGGTRNAHVRARDAMQLYVLSKENLDSVLEVYPDVEAVITRPLNERRQARTDAETLKELSTALATVMECDIAQWLRECGMPECEAPLRESMIETVDDLLFLAPEGDFELLMGLGLTSTQAKALRIPLHELLPPDQASPEAQAMDDITESSQTADATEESAEERAATQAPAEQSWMCVGVGEWLAQAQLSDFETALREHMVETVEDLLFLVPDGDFERVGLTTAQAARLQTALQAVENSTQDAAVDAPPEETAEDDDMTSMLLQMVEEAHETVQNMQTTKRAVPEVEPKQSDVLGTQDEVHTNRALLRSPPAAQASEGSGGRLRSRRRSEVISSDLSKLTGMLAALQDDVNSAASPRPVVDESKVDSTSGTTMKPASALALTEKAMAVAEEEVETAPADEDAVPAMELEPQTELEPEFESVADSRTETGGGDSANIDAELAGLLDSSEDEDTHVTDAANVPTTTIDGVRAAGASASVASEATAAASGEEDEEDKDDPFASLDAILAEQPDEIHAGAEDTGVDTTLLEGEAEVGDPFAALTAMLDDE